ncbi:MAG TPA: hypothetical protein VHF25_03480, partial [Nitriliruptorales bacterium]|nr:hypothetical protein [Nitriliruptorales bacterium]
MIDPRLLRDDPESVVTALARRGIGRADVERVVELERRRRDTIAEVEGLRAEQNARSRAIGTAPPNQRPQLIAAAAELKEPLRLAEDELAELTGQVEELLAAVPNLPHPHAPDGAEADSVELRRVGEPPRFDFAPRDHVDLMVAGGALD